MKYILILMLSLFMLSNQVYSKPPIFTDEYSAAQTMSKDLKLDIIIVFGADWCKYCKILKKDLTINEQKLSNKIFLFIDTDKQPDMARKYQVKSIPASFYLKNNKVISNKTGYNNINNYLKWINNAGND
tara:strand:+ start:678 stop:1064 length:387 start_codon:yes stop_codon:yes gene_type:complete